MSRTFRLVALPLAALVLLAACDGATPPDPPVVTGPPGVRVVSGDEAQDTIQGLPAARLVVEYRDARGLPVANQTLHFEGLSDPAAGDVTVQVANVPTDPFAALATVVTDSAGRASVRLRMGIRAGAAGVEVRSQPTGGQADTARYTVLPGAPARVRVAPRDTAVFIGRTIAPRVVSMTDRAGNTTQGAVAWSVLEGPLSVDAQSGVVGTPAYGTSRIVARAGIGADTVRVASVPVGAMAASHMSGGIVLMNFDGTARRVIHSFGTQPAWSPAGDRVLYQSQGLLYGQDLAGNETPVVAVPTNPGQGWPQYSQDGQWIYFHTAVSGQPQAMWRVRASDGGGLQRIGALTGALVAHPAPSPDGTRVAYYTGGGGVRVLDLGTGAIGDALAIGSTPSWSPTGELIAFSGFRGPVVPSDLSGPIYVVRPVGTGLRIVSRAGEVYQWAPRWSPDGQWLIASNWNKIHLIQVETGLTIELPWEEQLWGAAWKPGAPLQ
jgi:hypothetical protein